MKHAPDIKVRVAGCKGAFTAFALDADIPASSRKGESKALSGQLDFGREIVTIRKRGVRVPLRANAMGRYVLSAVEFGTWLPCSDRGPNLAASYSEWSFVEKRPDLSYGDLHLPPVESGILRCAS